MRRCKRIMDREAAHIGSPPLVSLAGNAAILPALAVALSLAFAGHGWAKAKSGYRAFAKLSNTEKVLKLNECKKYGGRPVKSHEPAVVMKSGRTDKQFYNVYWFGQHPYVAYKIDRNKSITGSIGLQPYTIWLCQF